MATLIAFICHKIILPNKPSFKRFSCESYKTFYVFACTIELKEDSLISGGAAGGLLVYLMKKGKFKSIPDVIKDDMTQAQRKRLLASVAAVIKDFRVKDIPSLVSMLLKNPGVKRALLKKVFVFIQKEMGLKIVGRI
jgi:hypothetical protein